MKVGRTNLVSRVELIRVHGVTPDMLRWWEGKGLLGKKTKLSNSTHYQRRRVVRDLRSIGKTDLANSIQKGASHES